MKLIKVALIGQPYLAMSCVIVACRLGDIRGARALTTSQSLMFQNYITIIAKHRRTTTSRDLWTKKQSSFKDDSLPFGFDRRRYPNNRLFQRGALVLKESHSGTSRTNISFDIDLQTTKHQFEEAMSLCAQNVASTTPLHQLKEFMKDLEREQSDPSFWDEGNSDRANQVNTQMSKYTRLINRLEQWQKWQDDAQAALEMLLASRDESSTESIMSSDEEAMLLEEFYEASKLLLEDSKRYELDLLLSGPYDQSPARVVLTAGAGGTEANDWVADLKRMYERHCAIMGFTCTIEDTQPGDVVGYKSVDMLISGPNAFGWMQGEKGSHRLVRLSPFNANNKRQTTFAGVDVAPADIFDDTLMQDFDIPNNDLEITTMRSGGPGGQNVNKINSAVRIKHIPSGLQVKCTQERNQAQNKVIAMRRLKAQLLAVAQEQRVQEIKEIRGDVVEASWGTQIRNYVLHPYKMVKDQRTGWETSNAQAFLDGELLEDCIGAYLRQKAQQARQNDI
ncbi:hypothetical protein ACA910_022202 [Epithemia clementina (nom. ined.)]